MECPIFGALPTKITHTTQAVRKDAFFSDGFFAQNIRAALYQKRTLCNRDRAKPYPCCKHQNRALPEARSHLGVRYMEERVYLKSGSLYEQIGESGHLKTVSL